jgi:transglutaminase-like putative cysteine protease
MRIRISHTTTYRYEEPTAGVIQTLRKTPRNHDGQHVVSWRIELSENCRLDRHEDAFGNIMHVFTADGPISELRLTVEGEVETRDTSGVISGAVERFPASLYLRETPLTRCDPAIAALAREAREAAGGDALRTMHGLVARLHGEMAFDPDPTGTSTAASHAYALRRGVCQDFSHIFIAAARCIGIPARYVGGHFHRSDGVADQEAGHAWAEAYIADLGWVAFDPAHGISATEAHVRVAVGLDYLGAAPVRGSRQGGGMESMEVAVRVAQSARQAQS